MDIKATPIAYEFAANEQKDYIITFDILDMEIMELLTRLNQVVLLLLTEEIVAFPQQVFLSSY